MKIEKLGVVCGLALTLTMHAARASAQEGPAALDRSVLADEARPEEERAQDAGRKVLEVYEWFGIEPGMTVADVFTDAGYNTHLLSRLMGESGRVYAVLGFYDGLSFTEGEDTFDVRLERRVAEKGLDNVTVVSDLADVPASSVDVAILVRNYHDVEWVMEGTSRRETLASLKSILVPGGIVGVVEVATDRPGWDEETHRLNKSVVVEDFTGAGFELAGESDLLANPDDDHSTSGFEQGRHTMDRYVLKFRKPVAP